MSFTIVDQVSLLRIEGIAVFFERRSLEFFYYGKDDVLTMRSKIINYDGRVLTAPTDRSLYYECGFYMCYFIGLSYLLRKSVKKFNSMRALVGKRWRDFLFFTEGFGYILNLDWRAFRLQNLPIRLSNALCKEMVKWSHLRFIKEYEEACGYLGVPENQIIISFEDNKRMKKIAFNEWKREVEQAGYSTEGIEPE